MVLLNYLVITLYIVGCTKADNANYSDILKSCLEVPNKICLTGNGSYSRPNSVLVETKLEVKQIMEIDVEKNSIKFKGFLAASWEDPGVIRSNGPPLMVREDWESLLWRPWLEFENILSFEKTQYFGGTKSFSFWMWKHPKTNGGMAYVEDLQITFFCQFQFIDYPFDSHDCTLNYSDKTLGLMNNVTLTPAKINFGNIQHKLGDDPIILDHLPFELKLTSLPSFNKIGGSGQAISTTGMHLKMKRKDFGKLLASYYYPMASFAVLSLISFLINPDIVSYSYYQQQKYTHSVL